MSWEWQPRRPRFAHRINMISSGADSVLSQTALGTHTVALLLEDGVRDSKYLFIHLCMWPEKQPDMPKIKVILLCRSSSEYHPRPETGGFCAIHG